MDDVLKCKECGIEITVNAKFCPVCKSNTEPAKPVKIQSSNKSRGFLNSPIFAIAQLIFGTWLLVMGSEWYFQLIGFGSIVLAVHTLYKYQKTKQQGNALTILKERYAKCEITKEEFDKLKKDMT